MWIGMLFLIIILSLALTGIVFALFVNDDYETKNGGVK
jgi:predicted membrane channel-forming protein YqfA (hemolysin III family)